MTPTREHPGLALIISGPSGAGKTTIAHAVVSAFSDAAFSVSLTTRPKSEREIDGSDYHFVTEEEFIARTQAPGPEGLGDFLEHAGVYGKRYGTLREPVIDALEDGRMIVLEIDAQGAKLVKSQIPDAFAVFILPPSDEALLQRLRDRKREGESAIQKRFANAQREIAFAKECGVYDLFVTNDDLPRAIRQLIDAVADRRGVPAP